MNERKRWMRGETKTARGDYSKIKGYKFGGMVRVGTGEGRNTPVVEAAVASATQAKKKKLRRR